MPIFTTPKQVFAILPYIKTGAVTMKKFRPLLGAALAIATATLTCLPVSCANGSLQQATQLYARGNFKDALASLESMVSSGKADANTYYYMALCYHQLKDWRNAKAYYQRVVEAYPNSPQRVQAQNALNGFYHGSSSISAGSGNPTTSSATTNDAADSLASLISKMRGEVGGGSGSPQDSLPADSYVYFERGPGGHLIIPAMINNRPMKMCFDTGASGSFFGKNHLRAVGISPPDGKPTGMSVGVAGTTPTWDATVDIKVGGIQKHLSVGVEEELRMEPLLGQDFFKGYQYQIDNGGHRIAFHKIQADGGTKVAKDNFSVPFTLYRGEMVVTLQRRGKKIKAVFDTGAASILLTPSDAEALGIEIPSDAEPTVHSGIGAGTRRGYRFGIDELQLGGYIKKDPVVDVVNSDISLIGQPFFSDARYTIDNDNQVIRFFH